MACCDLENFKVIPGWDALKTEVDEVLATAKVREAESDSIDVARAAQENNFQRPYVAFSKITEPRTMVPANLQEPLQVQGERKQRFRDYLNGGVTYGYMREAACAWFHDRDGIEHMHRSTDPEERGFYDDVYRFIKGTYEPK